MIKCIILFTLSFIIPSSIYAIHERVSFSFLFLLRAWIWSGSKTTPSPVIGWSVWRTICNWNCDWLKKMYNCWWLLSFIWMNVQNAQPSSCHFVSILMRGPFDHSQFRIADRAWAWTFVKMLNVKQTKKKKKKKSKPPLNTICKWNSINFVRQLRML